MFLTLLFTISEDITGS